MIADLERLNHKWNQAWLDKDAATVDRMMADDYVYIAPNGQVWDRPTILKIIQSPSYHLDKNGASTEVMVKPVGSDAGAVVRRWQGEGTFEGKGFKDDHRCTSLWVRRGSEWQVVLEQCTNNQ